MKKFVAFAAAVTAVPALVNPSFAQTEKTPAVLAQFKPGDHVQVTYAEMGDTRVVRTVVKG